MGMIVRLCAGAFLGFLSLSAAMAADGVYEFQILKEGEPIGREVVNVTTSGDRMDVSVQTNTRTKVMFLEFVHDHTRNEVWQNGQVVEMRSKTNDDGKPFEVVASRADQGWNVTVNGKAKTADSGAVPLILWNAEVLKHVATFGTIDAAPYNVKIENLGQTTLTQSGGTVEASHYRMSGDIERDLWYGPDGVLLKSAFKRSGYPIEFVRSASGRGG